jgi:hypothetical protein
VRGEGCAAAQSVSGGGGGATQEELLLFAKKLPHFVPISGALGWNIDYLKVYKPPNPKPQTLNPKFSAAWSTFYLKVSKP